MQRTLTTLSLTVLLAACGSSSDDSNGNPAGGPTGHKADVSDATPDGTHATDSGRATDDGSVTEAKPAQLEPGQAVFTGDAAASMFTPVEAVFAEGMFVGFQPGLMVAIGNKADACSRLSHYSVPRDSSFLGFGLVNNASTAPEEGTYDSPLSNPENILVAQFHQFDENCSTEVPKGRFAVAEDGQVVLTSVVHGKSATGTFKIMLEGASAPVVGAFNATYCDAHDILEAGGLSGANCAD